MEFTEKDRGALYNTWMSQKAKMRLTQMEVARKLGVSQAEFGELLRGKATLTYPFVTRFCEMLKIDPAYVLPAFRSNVVIENSRVTLCSRMTVDGDIRNVYVEGNQVIVEYEHRIN
ncbi:helix-turn-helix domain-containing protein [Vibrio gallicus]|uniref:helix-turn-helix domain-containing protein n=1 Tax=Vibrio gallicus TaxID=190897 RepID=UPI0021C37B1C|nr:helix-turn-helix transcriptional regulator [Vibrio gallicus]